MNAIEWARAELLHLAWRYRLYVPPDRRMLRAILAALADDPDCSNILFVGVQWYTADYPKAFAGRMFATIDPEPRVERFGGVPHVVERVENVAHAFPTTTFDAIVMNGVIGYGLDDASAVDRALAACAEKLRERGWLILGVNEEKPNHVDPTKMPSSALYEPTAFAPWAPAKLVLPLPFAERSHTFMFWQRR